MSDVTDRSATEASRPSGLAVAGALVALAAVIAIVLTANAGLLPRLLGRWYDIPAGDKLAHFVLIGLLAYLADGAIRAPGFLLGGLRLPRGSTLVWIGVTLEELSQLFLTHRTFSLTDLLCDYAGIAVAVALRAMGRPR